MRQGQSVIPGLAASIPIIGDTKKVTGAPSGWRGRSDSAPRPHARRGYATLAAYVAGSESKVGPQPAQQNQYRFPS